MPLLPILGSANVLSAPWTASTPSYASLGTLDNTGIVEVEEIVGTDLTTGLHGEVIMDQVTGGSRGMLLNMVLQEANLAAVRQLLRPWFYDSDIGFTQNTAGGNIYEGAVQPAGLLGSKIANFLKIRPVAGTEAAAVNSGNSTRFYKHVLLNNGQQISKTISYRERFIPIQLRVLPFLDTNNVLRFWEYIGPTA